MGRTSIVEPVAEDARSARDRLTRLQSEILEAVATGDALADVMDTLCRRVETFTPEVICSVLSVDHDGRLWTLAGPGLPEHYNRAIDGLRTGPKTGSCGTAAWRGEPVAVTDIEHDPLWLDYRDLALPLGLRACWSSPIKARDQRVIGTFAFYYRSPRAPTDFERAVVSTCVHICAIAIEHDTAQSVIHRLAFTDMITGLPNRAHFQMAATEAIEHTIRSGNALAIHCIDLDDFKGVNDTLGHARPPCRRSAPRTRCTAAQGMRGQRRVGRQARRR